jgi:hypothetical protein
MMMQFHIPAKPEMIALDPNTIAAQPSMTAAIVLCQTVAGLEDKQLVGAKGIVKHAEQWSRIKGGSQSFPHDQFETLFDACRNEAPLVWLARRRGYGLIPLETELERQLRLANEELAHERELRAYAENLLARR